MIGPSLPSDDDDDDEENARIDPSTPWAISETLTSQNISRNKRLKAVAKGIPWADCYEFHRVGQSLPTTAVGRKRRRDDEEEHSLDHISAWKVRMGNRLPHAVESSYQLSLCLRLSSSSGAEAQRLALASAILRAINGVADALQQLRAQAQSVAVLCAELGIPSWLVDVRHAATHNQMPSFAVLKLAASTLLEYFRREYWQASNTTESILLNHLLAYQERQTKIVDQQQSSKQKKKSSQKAAKKKTAAKPNIDSDQDSDEEMYLNGSNTSFWERQSSRLGTSNNQFAALMMVSGKSKSKKQKTQHETQQPQTKPKQKNKELSAHHHAKQFVKQGMNHLEEAYKTLLLFLVWGGTSREAALAPTDLPQTNESIHKLRQRYNILLTAAGTEWPGFLSSLLVHLVDCTLSSTTTQSFFLESWIRHLVSGDFLAQLNLAPKTMARSKKPAPWKYLEKLRYPLNSLCDRLKQQPSTDDNPTCQRLANLLEEILGSRRVRNFGLPQTITAAPQTEESTAIQESSSNQATLSLQDTEAMLEGTPNDPADASNSAPPATQAVSSEPTTIATQRPAWVRCSVWEPCAIGALPGRPFSSS